MATFTPTYGNRSSKSRKPARAASKPAAKPARVTSADVYQAVTESVIKAMESGSVPWRQQWKNGQPKLGAMPSNRTTGKTYRGINTWVLLSAQIDAGYASSQWLTFNQAKAMGGSVKKGEKGTPVIFWRILEKNATDAVTGEESKERIPMARLYYVFNTDQCDSLPSQEVAQAQRTEFEAIEAAEAIFSGMPLRPEVRHGGNRACYSPRADQISMPAREAFKSPASYYSVLFHEMGHSTGHASRLNRDGIVSVNLFGDHSYSQEELVAEMTAAFLSAEAGILPSTLDDSAAYCRGWLSKLKNDRQLFVKAAGEAQKAADFILDRKAVKADSEASEEA